MLGVISCMCSYFCLIVLNSTKHTHETETEKHICSFQMSCSPIPYYILRDLLYIAIFIVKSRHETIISILDGFEVLQRLLSGHTMITIAPPLVRMKL